MGLKESGVFPIVRRWAQGNRRRPRQHDATRRDRERWELLVQRAEAPTGRPRRSSGVLRVDIRISAPSATHLAAAGRRLTGRDIRTRDWKANAKTQNANRSCTEEESGRMIDSRCLPFGPPYTVDDGHRTASPGARQCEDRMTGGGGWGAAPIDTCSLLSSNTAKAHRHRLFQKFTTPTNPFIKKWLSICLYI